MPVPPCQWCSSPNFNKLELTSAFVDYYRCETGHIVTVDKPSPSAVPVASLARTSAAGNRIEGCPARMGDRDCCALPLNR